MGKQTPLYDKHVVMGAKMVDFGGWDMPLRYGSQIDEHHQVRNDAGMFDVSHMSVVDFTGPHVREFLRRLFANNVDRLTTQGKALYTCMLNEQGGVIDDLIVYYMDDSWFRVVFNAATHDKDLAWAQEQAQPFAVEITEPAGLAMIAVQGPSAREKVCAVFDAPERSVVTALAPFTAAQVGEWFVSRTGYTGEDGFEIILPGSQAGDLWRSLYGEGVQPIGLAARDTLRLEAGMNLYGLDMDEETSPLVAGLGWTVAWEPDSRDFIGREALEKMRSEGVTQKFVGLILEDKGVLRSHQKVIVNGHAGGEITSGGFSPTLGKSIAFARVPKDAAGTCKVEIRNKQVTAQIVKLPFVRNGKAVL
ncbi:glycine cleavage system aminomethyltransferase GcvT [Sulfuriflexus sp.]|uniref:glycine cleavage system aminomethyltransferase GcvT n=1 Tax=Sulfuriflexus sp. TaxID=2015443 RepID=UPI0028CC6754|nr:glycine cleavage system aminomethyltransferase GcvT [Sulfuriflexus sp.]MDT8403373.1 glycine cleavage system aminomethyltransferase GcvT [Sulfuriflexus sp.]